MTRGSRRSSGNQLSDADDSVIVGGRRSRRKVNYTEGDASDDDVPLPKKIKLTVADSEDEQPTKEALETSSEADDDHGGDDDDDDDDDEYETRKRRTVRKRPKVTAREHAGEDDDDVSFNEDDDEDDLSDFTDSSDERTERQREHNHFIVKDDEDDDNSYGSHRRRAKKRQPKKINKQTLRSSRSERRRGLRSSVDSELEENEKTVDFVPSSEHDASLMDELADLQDSDATPRPRRGRFQRAETTDLDSQPRSLRERKKEINYTLPPPLSENLDDLSLNVTTASPRRRGGAGSRPIWRLFPTGGPFGGGDVTSLFGKNYPGIAANNSSLLAGGVDSDSSDDEILPIGGTSKKHSISAPVAASAKKKQIADSDPLGVNMDIDFSAVGGLDNYINQLKEMVALPLLYPEVYQRFSITPPRGVLFHGPPGTGKTLMARALAASCSSEGRNITFFMRKGADCLSKWVGEAERQLRLLFEEAKKQQPSIIFFDEIDGLAPVRSSKQEQIHASIVSTLLALMDGMDNRGQVIVIGATNRPDAVDPALRRPGRFDREFYFPLPDIKARKEILAIHTKKWDPPLSQEFISKIAHLTKGYGGADLRALCTEAALNSIQRKYPQIYSSNDKLEIDPSLITVSARDFMKAVEKIIPSSTRSTSTGSAPIPDQLVSLLQRPLDLITSKLDKLIPRIKKLTTLEEAEFEDPTEDDKDGGFAKQEFIRLIESSRVHRPRLLISGHPGSGQQYLGSAVLNHLEGFNVQSLDLGSLFGDSIRTAETTIIQSFIEARRHKPSIIYIPYIDIWYNTLPESAKSTLAGLLRSVSSNERILLLGIAEQPGEELDSDLKLLFGISDSNFVELSVSFSKERKEFFKPLWNALEMRPTEFLDTRKKRKLPKLPKLKEITLNESKEENLKALEKQDMRLKNTLKIKLSGLMDLFKSRYRKFKKPIIDPMFLGHLFEPLHPNAPAPLYTRDGNQILEIATGRRYYNMDLDTIEERLWNGFYSEPKQFLKDIEMIYSDSVESQDRERLIKASEMLANAQVGIEEISTPELVEQCKALRRREVTRIKQHEEEVAKLKASREADVTESTQNSNSFSNPMVLTETNALLIDGTNITIANEIPQKNDSESIDEGVHRMAPFVQAETKPKSVDDDMVLVETHVHPGNGRKTKSAESDTMSLQKETLKENSKGNGTAKELIEHMSGAEGSEEEFEEGTKNGLPDFILDTEAMKKAQLDLVKRTEGLTLEVLEQINAQMMEILWDGHGDWDRNMTLERLKVKISEIDYL